MEASTAITTSVTGKSSYTSTRVWSRSASGSHTLFCISRLEIEANRFAAELLCPDELLQEYPGYSLSQIARSLGLREEVLACKQLGEG